MGRHATKFPGIFVEYDETKDLYFRLSVNEALEQIAKKPIGARLLHEIAGSNPASAADGYKVLIHAPDKREFTQAGYSHPVFGNMVQDGSPCTASMLNRGACDNANAADNVTDSETSGRGSTTKVRWNSNITTLRLTSDQVPPFICLAHELIHAHHCLYGTKKPNARTINHPQGGQMTIGEEEFYTVGVRGFEKEPITENKLRGEWRIKARDDYP